MAEEAIQAVRKAETEAAALIKDAGAKRDAMLLKAKQDAEQRKNETQENAAAKKAAALEALNKKNDMKLQDATKQAEAEIANLKKLAETRQNDAIKLVIGRLA